LLAATPFTWARAKHSPLLFTYARISWSLNRSGIEPNITFRIELPDGTVLKEYETGNIPSTPGADWKQYGFYFATPPNQDQIVLRLTNNAPGGIGNDLGLDDITFRPCGPKVEARIEGVDNPVDACHPHNQRYAFRTNVSTDYARPLYQWQISTDKGPWTDIPGATGGTYEHLPTGTSGSYRYRMTVVEERNAAIRGCRIASDDVSINIHPVPVVNAGPDRTVIIGRSTNLDAQAEGEELSWTWTPETFLENPESLKPKVKPTSDQLYTLTATSPWGCTASDQVAVSVIDKFHVPNAFTPNGDGLNDVWKLPFLDPTLEAGVRVYNRFGQLVFQTETAQKGWNGTFNGQLQPTGTYVYLIVFKEGPVMKGTVTLIR
jgi:gliding motility-associated-like protein